MPVINTSLPKTKTYNKKFISAELTPSQLNQLIEDQGVRARIYRTLLCPNRKSIDSAEHDINCSICKTKVGFIDIDPVESFVYIGSQDLTKQFNPEGVWDEQGAVMTFPSGVEVFYYAKVELIDFTTPMIELIQRQHGDTDRVKYPAYSYNVVIDSAGVRYYQDTDFKADINSDIIWLTANRPAYSTVYAVHYNYPVTFRALNAIHINRFGQLSHNRPTKEPIELPQQWMVKRDYLIERKDLDGNLLLINKIINQQQP